MSMAMAMSIPMPTLHRCRRTISTALFLSTAFSYGTVLLYGMSLTITPSTLQHQAHYNTTLQSPDILHRYPLLLFLTASPIATLPHQTITSLRGTRRPGCPDMYTWVLWRWVGTGDWMETEIKD
ncbi:hypothetical protein C7974DRAFT_390186 [Boeremia exigua]|uniref:uncharacterized protein n=1 Tax=Boeremia exigua TaxID=749465 RepID=UPI001E8D8819|nr:uncharacterized protein C7974DRAFT_390186 [Boeremia exigua]KAH6637751.1 hypothetical protein C7974DRAFT_390186 [Boeremia exigua]